MKVILTGSTGFIGKEVLLQCLGNASITSIVALSRHALPVSDPKLNVVLVDDFTSYPSGVLSQLENADACIWCLGAKTADVAIQRKVSIDYTVAALNTFSKINRVAAPSSSSADASGRFRLVFTSGILAVRDQHATPLFAGGARKAKGEAENQVLEFAKTHEDWFDAFITRPASVVLKAGDGGFWVRVRNAFPAKVGVDQLAAVMVDLALNGGRTKILENGELVKRGKVLLKEAE